MTFGIVPAIFYLYHLTATVIIMKRFAFCLTILFFVASPEDWIKKLAADGKSVTLPDGYTATEYDNRTKYKLYIVASRDKYSKTEDIPDRQSEKTTVKVFDSDHISSFNTYPDEYIEEIMKFVSR